MGILGHFPFIRSKVGKGIIKERDFSYFNKMKIGIDTSLIVYQMGISARGSGNDMTNKQGGLTSHLSGIFDKTIKMLGNQNIPIYVFDGEPPTIKDDTLEERDDKKFDATEKMETIDDPNSEDYIKYFQRTFKPTQEDYDELKIMFDLMGIPYIQAPGEADVVLSWLASRYDANEELLIDGVCSNDSDMLVHGSQVLFKDMFATMNRNPKKCSVFVLETILTELDITRDQYIDMSVMMGCDFSKRIKDVGPAKVYNLVKSKGDIQGATDELKKQNKKLGKQKFDINDDKIKSMKRARDYFRNSVNELDDTFKIKKDNITLKKVQFDALMDFMCNKHNFKANYVESGIRRLLICYEKMGIIRENNNIVHQISKTAINRGIECLSSESE